MTITVQRKCQGSENCGCPLCAAKAAAEQAQVQQKAPMAAPESNAQAVQRKGGDNDAAVQMAAQEGVSGTGSAVPYQKEMEGAFGTDFGSVQAHMGGEAQSATSQMGAQAYAMGNNVAFGTSSPDKGLVAHELTHVVQQKAGVQLKGGVGKAGDAYEQEADSVAARVTAGQSVNDVVQKYSGGGATTAVQGNMLGDAWNSVKNTVTNAGQAVVDTARNVVNAVIEWIDLLGPKMALLTKIRDGQWAVAAIKEVKTNAHPKHKTFLDLSLFVIVTKAKFEALGYALKIAGCNDKKSVEQLDKDYEKWRDTRGKTLRKEVEDKVDEYRKTELQWLDTFGKSAAISKDPINANQAGQKARLELKPGVPSGVVTVETSVNYAWTLSTAATAAKTKLPTDAEKTTFHTKFQDQLDAVWKTPTGGTAPFRLSSPDDYLLETATRRWSGLTATMQGKVTKATAAKAHFTITVETQTPAESSRASVGTGSGHFFRSSDGTGDHTEGYDNKGAATGGQMTLAHEWLHMIGNPDEYAENSSSQTNDATTNPNFAGGSAAHIAEYKQRFPRCLKHFQDIIGDPKASAADKAKATADLDAIQRDPESDPATGNLFIHRFANRPDIPDDCFAVRNSYGSAKPGGGWDSSGSQFLRPGAQSERGGTNISQNAADERRLSVRGNEVRPYLREGIVQELRGMLAGKFDPEVNFDHNFKDMSKADIKDVVTVRVQNLFRDISASMGSSKAPSNVPTPEQDIARGGGHSHDHGADHDH